MADRTALGVNIGPDARLPWPFGPLLGGLQQQASFKSSTPPIKIVEGSEDDGWLTEESYSEPHAKPFYGWATRRPDGHWDTFRIGHRWDPNWGDQNVQGYNPDPHIVGGYFPDVIVKRGQKVPHIYPEGVAGPDAIAALRRQAPWWYAIARAAARAVGATG